MWIREASFFSFARLCDETALFGNQASNRKNTARLTVTFLCMKGKMAKVLSDRYDGIRTWRQIAEELCLSSQEMQSRWKNGWKRIS